MAYEVVTKTRDDEEFVEVVRTDKRAAEDDVSLLKSICRKKSFMREVPDIYQRNKS